MNVVKFYIFIVLFSACASKDVKYTGFYSPENEILFINNMNIDLHSCKMIEKNFMAEDEKFEKAVASIKNSALGSGANAIYLQGHKMKGWWKKTVSLTVDFLDCPLLPSMTSKPYSLL